MIKEKLINITLEEATEDTAYQQPIFLWVEVVSMSVKEVSLYFLGCVPIQYFGLDPIDPQSSSIVLLPWLWIAHKPLASH